MSKSKKTVEVPYAYGERQSDEHDEREAQFDRERDAEARGNGIEQARGGLATNGNNPEIPDSGKKKETKAERFLRLAPKRMSKALKALQGIKALAGSNYEHTEQQTDRILSDLQRELGLIQAAFTGIRAVKNQGWSF